MGFAFHVLTYLTTISFGFEMVSQVNPIQFS